MSDRHVLVNRASWDEDAPNWVERGREAWAKEEPAWARGNPESELHLLPDVAGLDVIELGCGTAYVSAWLMLRGARMIALDNSSNQLATARMLQEEFDLRFSLLHADAEHAPFAMRASTSRSLNTALRSGATRTGGSLKRAAIAPKPRPAPSAGPSGL